MSLKPIETARYIATIISDYSGPVQRRSIFCMCKDLFIQHISHPFTYFSIPSALGGCLIPLEIRDLHTSFNRELPCSDLQILFQDWSRIPINTHFSCEKLSQVKHLFLCDVHDHSPIQTVNSIIVSLLASKQKAIIYSERSKDSIPCLLNFSLLPNNIQYDCWDAIEIADAQTNYGHLQIFKAFILIIQIEELGIRQFNHLKLHGDFNIHVFAQFIKQIQHIREFINVGFHEEPYATSLKSAISEVMHKSLRDYDETYIIETQHQIYVLMDSYFSFLQFKLGQEFHQIRQKSMCTILEHHRRVHPDSLAIVTAGLRHILQSSKDSSLEPTLNEYLNTSQTPYLVVSTPIPDMLASYNNICPNIDLIDASPEMIALLGTGELTALHCIKRDLYKKLYSSYLENGF